MDGYEGATMIKTFRGLMADNTQDTIVLHTNDGSTGYRIVKFQLMAEKPGAVHNENVVKVYTVSQATNDAVIDFSDPTLLAAGFYVQDASRIYNPSTTVIFDNMIFNQDIYVTHKVVDESGIINYYIELEQVKLDLGENTVATLKNVRNLEPGQI